MFIIRSRVDMSNYPKTVKIDFPSGATVTLKQNGGVYDLVYEYEGYKKKLTLREAKGGEKLIDGRIVVKARGIYIN